MLSVTRRVKDPESLRTELQLGLVFDQDHLIFWNRPRGTPQEVHFVSVNPGGTSNQFCGINEVRDTSGVCINLGSKLFGPSPGGASVVQVNMRSQQMANVGGSKSECPHPLYDSVEDGLRPAVYQQ